MLPDRAGTYVLILRLTESRVIACGGLGQRRFPSGWYAYVGSAHGPGGLAARLGRHLRATGCLHWHIDYLRAQSQPVEVWYTADPARRECAWAEVLLQLPGAEVVVPRFGASDCRCWAHLARFAYPPERLAFSRAVGEEIAFELIA